MKNETIKIYHNTAISKEHGLEVSAVFNHIAFWIEINKKNQCNNINGKTFTTTTYKDISSRLKGVLSERQIRLSIEKLKKAGLIEGVAITIDQKIPGNSYCLTAKGAEFLGGDSSDRGVTELTGEGDSSDRGGDRNGTPIYIDARASRSKTNKKKEEFPSEDGGATAPQVITPEIIIPQATVPVTSLTTLLDPEPDQDAKDIAECIYLFTPFNPNIRTLYGNKTQRKAAAELLEKYGLPWVQSTMMEIIGAWREGDRFVPKVHNPWLFLSKLADVQDWDMRRKNNKKVEEEKQKVYIAPR